MAWVNNDNGLKHLRVQQQAGKRIRLPQPHEGQARILDDISRFKVLDCGRRWGKSTYLFLECALALIKNGERVAYLAPTFTMLLDFWNELKTILAPLIEQKSEQEKMIRLKNGGYFKGFSGNNPEVIRGGKYHLFLIDEAAVIPDLENVWNKIIRSTLSDYVGKAVFGSTPRGNNFFKTVFDRGVSKDPRYKDYSSYTEPSWNNKFLRRDEILSSVMDVSEKAARQEIMAEFLADAGSVFVGVTKAATGNLFEPYDGNFVMGADLARKNDFTVICVYDIDLNQVVDYIRFNSISWQAQVDKIVDYNEKWGSPSITVEENNVGDVICELLEDRGLDLTRLYTGGENKRIMVEGMAADIQWDRIVLPSDPNVISEFQTFESKITETGKSKYGAPNGFYDDIVISFCIARYAALGHMRAFGGALPVLGLGHV